MSLFAACLANKLQRWKRINNCLRATHRDVCSQIRVKATTIELFSKNIWQICQIWETVCNGLSHFKKQNLMFGIKITYLSTCVVFESLRLWRQTLAYRTGLSSNCCHHRSRQARPTNDLRLRLLFTIRPARSRQIFSFRQTSYEGQWQPLNLNVFSANFGIITDFSNKKYILNAVSISHWSCICCYVVLFSFHICHFGKSSWYIKNTTTFLISMEDVALEFLWHDLWTRSRVTLQNFQTIYVF